MRRAITVCAIMGAVLLLVSGTAFAVLGYSGGLVASQEVPPNASTATGAGFVVLDGTETSITVMLSFTGLSAAATAAHIHGPAAVGVNAPVLFSLSPPAVTAGTITPATFAVTPAQVADLKAGLWYFNVHTATFPGGEIRAQIGAAPTYTTTLSGANEVPPNAGTASGAGLVVVHAATNQLTAMLDFAGLTGSATAGHIHGPAAVGVNGPVIFNLAPPALASGSVTPQIFTASAQQITDLGNNLWYLNVHTATFPGGEIRGQLTLSSTPVELVSFAAE